MIESHHDPDSALTDKEQQIKPEALNDLFERIQWRSKSIDKTEFSDKINLLREELKELDDELLSIFFARMKISNDIGKLKKENNLAILQTKYWDERLKYLMAIGKRVYMNSF